ncbi:hypothetical protein KPSA3_00896 [Pseudomonas syringae pv. actinidiae]|uniref:Uncharacterized protein n=1 Tax=Pseudomonas syringae pv. actinidiae TaxID=103796 RepID=A0AAN4Q0B8_PSESF|nr:hypothetical protein KPSA3_00896 [Pseudomonas syringae pv. actinidiae]
MYRDFKVPIQCSPPKKASWPSNVQLTGFARRPCPTNRPSQSGNWASGNRKPSWLVSSV